MTILIKNGLVYDGAGDEPEKLDILVRGERIARLGNFFKKDADQVIDAAGGAVVPGFIDINSPADHYLDILATPPGENLIRDGVTTILGGNCGASLAPLLKGSLDSVRKWGNTSKVNINWTRIHEFLKFLERIGLGVNFGTLVGFGTVRRGLVGEVRRDLTDRELETLKKVVSDAFKDGAFGLSTGLEFAHGKSISARELLEMAGVAAAENRVYATHLRDRGKNLESSFTETLKIARETGVSVEVSHLMPEKGREEVYLNFKNLLEKQTAETHINFDCYPGEAIALPVYQLLPEWAREGNLETMLQNLNSSHLKKELLKHFRKLAAEDIVIFHVPPPLGFLSGKSLRDYAEVLGLKSEESLLKLMQISNLKAVILEKSVSQEALADFLLSPSALIASGEMRGFKVFGEFLRWAVNGKKAPLGKAVAKITSLPAFKYKIAKRGMIKEDYYADLVVLRDLAPTDVLINGRVALKDGNFQNILAGQVLRHAS